MYSDAICKVSDELSALREMLGEANSLLLAAFSPYGNDKTRAWVREELLRRLADIRDETDRVRMVVADQEELRK